MPAVITDEKLVQELLAERQKKVKDDPQRIFLI